MTEEEKVVSRSHSPHKTSATNENNAALFNCECNSTLTNRIVEFVMKEDAIAVETIRKALHCQVEVTFNSVLHQTLWSFFPSFRLFDAVLVRTSKVTTKRIG